MVEIKDITATPVLGAMLNDDGSPIQHELIAHQGGSRSSKTHSICQYLILWCWHQHLQGNEKKITIARKYNRSHQEGALQTLLKALGSQNVPYDRRKQPDEFHIYNQRLLFIGADQTDKLHGPERDLLWCNEANELNREDWDQLVMRTKGQIIIDFNPKEPPGFWLYDIIDHPKKHGFKSLRLIKSNYHHNPFVTDRQRRKYEAKKITDPYGYRVYTLGERATPPNVIYNAKERGSFPFNTDWTCYGLDFGFGESKNALVKVGRKDADPAPKLFVKELLYRSGMTVSDLLRFFEEQGISKTIPMYADPAEAEQIEEIARAGYNIHKAKKDVQAGINKVLEHQLILEGDNLWNEASIYRRKRDRNGNILEGPVKKDDHLMDSLRYACFTHMTSQVYEPAFGHMHF